MEREFAPYQEALVLKELGFDEPCFAFFNGKHLSFARFDILGNPLDICNCIEAPTYSQAFRFFREKYGYCSYIKEAIVDDYRFYIEKFDEKYYNSSIFKSYEEAELECLKKLIQIVKEK